LNEQLLRDALSDLQAELRSLDDKLTDLRALQERRNHLFALVTQMRFLLGMGVYVPSESESSQEADPEASTTYLDTSIFDQVKKQQEELSAAIVAPFQRTSKIWELARNVLLQVNKPMTIGEIVEALKAFDPKLSGRSGTETVRSILYKKSDVFEKMPDGLYQLNK
jgi:hypothetical protein